MLYLLLPDLIRHKIRLQYSNSLRYIHVTLLTLFSISAGIHKQRSSHLLFHSELGTHLANHLIMNPIQPVPSAHICLHQCAVNFWCTSINYRASDRLCELNMNHRTFDKPEVHYVSEGRDRYVHYHLL